jgi:hypothetical protein
VAALRNHGIGTNEGVRFKSARTRGGFIEDVLIRDLKLENVPLPFTFTLNWNPSYSYATIPKEVTEIPPHWRALTTAVPPERGLAEFHDITIENVQVTGAKRILTAAGVAEKPLRDVRFANVQAEGKEAGSIDFARDWKMEDVKFVTVDGAPLKIKNCENVQTPAVAGK